MTDWSALLESSIPQVGQTHGIRCPSVFVWPGTTRLHICTSISGDYNHCYNHDLTADQWYQLRITQRQESVGKRELYRISIISKTRNNRRIQVSMLEFLVQSTPGRSILTEPLLTVLGMMMLVFLKGLMSTSEVSGRLQMASTTIFHSLLTTRANLRLFTLSIPILISFSLISTKFGPASGTL